MSDERAVMINRITTDLIEIITTHVQREMASASAEELAAFQNFVTKERAAAKAASPAQGDSALLDLVMQKAREYKKK
ncbi:MAG: hypothetical protein AAF360_16715 [Pseudomonadota bacterium]